MLFWLLASMRTYNKANYLILFLCTFAARVGSRYEWGQNVVVIYDNGRYSSVAIAVSSVPPKKVHDLHPDSSSLVHNS